MMDEQELNYHMKALAGFMEVLKEQEKVFEEQTAKLRAQIDQHKEILKAEFLIRKESAQSEWLVVSYRKGAVRWDSAGLKAYAKTHPELKVYQKTGEPTIAFSLPKKEDDALVTMEERDGKAEM